MSMNVRKIVTLGLGYRAGRRDPIDRRRLVSFGLWPFNELEDPSYTRKFTLLLIDKTREINLRG